MTTLPLCESQQAQSRTPGQATMVGKDLLLTGRNLGQTQTCVDGDVLLTVILFLIPIRAAELACIFKEQAVRSSGSTQMTNLS